MRSLLFVLTLMFSQLAFGGVNLKNGNWYISYSDILVPGAGEDLEIIRTYNSKSLDIGWFGLSWGSTYETYLRPAADGSVIIQENGAGALTRFVPKSSIDPKEAAQKIIAEMKKKSPLNTTVEKKLFNKLINDQELRQSYAKKFKVRATIAAGTVLYSNDRGLQQVHKLKDGYKRVFNDGKTEFFNEKGKLTKISDKNGYKIELNYGKDGYLTSIKDSHAKQLFFDWYSSGRVKAIWANEDKKTAYKYEKRSLVESKDIEGNVYKYKYDGDYNMSEIAYADGTKMSISYTKREKFVEQIVDRNGNSTKYEYGEDAANPDYHYWTYVTKKSITGKPVRNKYEYEIKSRPDGSLYTYRIYTEINNVKTETIYSECCSLPLKITRGKHVTTFEYNSKGLLTKKSSTKGEYVELDYHPKYNKITQVKNKDGWTKFEYDKKGNLQKADNNKGKSVMLFYDRRGRITKMVDYQKKSKKRRTLTFKYNALGKPIEIAMSKVGKINVAYDNYGEIKKVESKAGQKMALQVTQAFQSLLSIVKPAGVNLSL
jgi:YD repeat-containing protein